MNSATSVPQTILAHLGGGRFVVMTGASQFLSSTEKCGTLIFRLPGKPGFVKNRINRVKVSLNASDLYDIEFTHIAGPKRRFAVTVVKSLENLFSVDLQETFTEITGLDTHL